MAAEGKREIMVPVLVNAQSHNTCLGMKHQNCTLEFQFKWVNTAFPPASVQFLIMIFKALYPIVPNLSLACYPLYPFANGSTNLSLSPLFSFCLYALFLGEIPQLPIAQMPTSLSAESHAAVSVHAKRPKSLWYQSPLTSSPSHAQADFVLF